LYNGRVTRGRVGGGETSVVFHLSNLKTHIFLTIYNTALVKNAKTKPNACSWLENYQNLRIFNNFRAIEAQSWVKKFDTKMSFTFFDPINSLTVILRKIVNWIMNYDFSVWYYSDQKCLWQKDVSFIVVSIHLNKLVRLWITEIYPITDLTPRRFSSISQLFTNIQIVYLHKSKLWWKTHSFCNRNFFYQINSLTVILKR